MKLSEAIDLYIHRRRAVGAYLHGPETILRSFLHHYGNLDLHRIRTSQITQFLNGRRGVRPSTWRGKYGALKLFFVYWCLRGRLRQSPVPLTVPKPLQDFIPYIYARAELLRLVKALPQCNAAPPALSLLAHSAHCCWSSMVRACGSEKRWDYASPMWTSHKTSFASAKRSFTKRDLCRSVTMSIESSRTASYLQIEKIELTLLCSNPKHASVSNRPLHREPSSDCGKCAGCSARTLLRFNPESMIFATRSQFIA